jgi:hypothetical protein
MLIYKQFKKKWNYRSIVAAFHKNKKNRLSILKTAPARISYNASCHEFMSNFD